MKYMQQEEDQSQLDASWTETVGGILQDLDVSAERGLTDQEAKRRRRKYGSNRLREKEPQSGFQIFLNQFKSVIVLILVGAAILSFAFGQIIDGFAISVAVLLNTLIGFVMEMRAVRSMESLRRMEQITANVLRNGQIRAVSADQLVPGDVVVMESGDVVSADMRLLEANKTRANESALTGESVPVNKQVDPVPQDALLPDRKNMLYKGTAITSGSCTGVVTHTGMNTELGNISSLVEQAEDEETPLEKRLQKLGQRLLWVTLGILVVVAVTGIVRGKETLLMIETAIALAVAAIPEGLPIVATVAMARGMLRMARRNALVNRLAAVEALGSTTVICTDKTGTLTENRMSVSRIITDENEFLIKKEEAESLGFFCNDKLIQPLEHPALRMLLEASVLCNNASLDTENEGAAIGDPLEIALLEAGSLAGLERKNLLEEYPEQREEAFDPSVKMMATFNKDANAYRVMVKGAPEAVLQASSRIQSGQESHDMTSDQKRKWNDKNLQLAREGLRILAVATKHSDSVDDDPYRDLTFLGLLAMVDPPRQQVAEAIGRCRKAGIRVVMVTGDHTTTAESIAQAVGLDDDNAAEAAEGTQIKPPQELSQQQRDKLVQTSIFSRVSPEQKLHLIDLHKQTGAVVAMTGDGVNDAPALKKADIGVAMGQRGTQVARAAADMILKDDAFSSIVVAIEQGRVIFSNIRKFVLYLLSGNASEILVVFLATLLNWPLPILPLQILFLNVINDVFPALALGVGKGSDDMMARPPRNPKEPVLTFAHWWAIFAYGVLIMAPVLTVFYLAATVLDMSDEQAVTVSFLTLAFARLWHIFNMRGAKSRTLRNEITMNPYVWTALLFCTALLIASAYTPGLSGVLSLSGPGATEWLLIAPLSLIPLVVGQIIKGVRTFRSRVKS
jgi:Ca2+-transporting ATPase